MKRGYGYILIAVLFFSTFEVAAKYIAGELHPIQLTCIRFFIGCLFLIPLAYRTFRTRGKPLTGSALGSFALLGLIGVSICMPIYQLAIYYADSAVVAVLFSCNPVFASILAAIFLKEPLKGRHITAFSLEILGTLAMIYPLRAQLHPLGIGLTFLATALFSLYGVMGKRKVVEYGGAVVTCFSFGFGSLLLLTLIGFTHLPWISSWLTSMEMPALANIPLLQGITWENLPYILYVSAGVAGIGFCCYFMAMEYQPVSVVSLVYFFKPVLSPILGWALHQEKIPGNMLLGIVLIVLGSLCAILPNILEAKRGRAFGGNF